MRALWVDIERLVVDGVALDPAKGRRLANLTQIALERLLRERGIAAQTAAAAATDRQDRRRPARGAQMKSPAADEMRWADELAEALYRAIDRGA